MALPLSMMQSADRAAAPVGCLVEFIFLAKV